MNEIRLCNTADPRRASVAQLSPRYSSVSEESWPINKSLSQDLASSRPYTLNRETVF